MPQKEYKEITTISEYIANNKNSIVLSDRAKLIKFAAKEKLNYYDEEGMCALVTIDWKTEGLKGRDDFSHTYSIICKNEETFQAS